MGRWNLKIVLKSDLCTATGEDMPGITNIKTALKHGIPYIPAKRIKGCLLEAGKEMQENSLIEQTMLECLFGKVGAERTEGIYIEDAHLYLVPGYLFGGEKEEPLKIDNYELFQMEVQNCQEDEKAYFEEQFTRRRTRTAICGKTGAARKHSLRTIQVVPAGVHFVSSLEGELSEEEEKVLLKCVKGLRHIGVGITRGLGEVECTLEAVPAADSEFEGKGDVLKENVSVFHKLKTEGEVVLHYEITLDSPMVTDGTGDSLPAGAVSGAFAGMYIRKYSLGDKAHTDENFSRIFLHDGVQFGDGFLKRQEKIYYPCPKAIAEIKEDKGNWFHVESEKEQKRKEIHGLVHWADREIHLISPLKEVHFHHSRPADRGIGHALNDRAVDTSNPTGEFFQYTVLSKGQTYAGTIRGKAKDIQSLAECLKDYGYRMRLGKSKTAEYGKCTFKIMNIKPKKSLKESSPCGKKWMLWLLTPMILRDVQTGEYTLEDRVFQRQLEKILECKVIELRKVAGSYTTYGGYNSKWRLPSVSFPAIGVGSTYYLETDREIYSYRIQDDRWGELTGKGCGQAAVRLWNKEEKGKIIFDTDEVNVAAYRTTGITGRLLYSRKKQLECEQAAIEELESIDVEKLPPSSAIALLSQLMRSHAENEDFYKQIKEEVEHIQKAEKRKRVMELIGPCEGKSYQFMKLYLENAKWKARGRSRDGV